ncbi:YtxH domain-containing protein [Nonlabens sp. Ci31]|uniref:YtxH domain-containing protein n=1 Tax=Nonlabens sp. Ci31 TaxID=2608253 RepID=UPI001463836E|nr:YtxH domain-containing protein [Nonlabens sp. Ci31]QJP33793.1 YtxH domain-containing protein [Nonlabens sp. Ci31]
MSKSVNTLIALAAGAAIGAAAGLLYAPESGEKTRKKIKKQAKKAQRDIDEQARKTYAQVSEKASHFTSSINSTATELKGSVEDRIETALSSASFKADDAIVALESKLEQLREQNAKLQKPTSTKAKL